jgi:uncharacterized protein (DUF2236 family)
VTAPDLFPTDSIARRLDREMFLLLGGAAALLLQVAHPLVAAGVAQHSLFREEPFGRLHRTLDSTLTVVYGEPYEARDALRRIDGKHATVRGTAPDGRAYRARDPRLLLWVQATLVLTSLRMYELVLGPLPPAQRALYWSETQPIAMALGVPATLLPPTLADLEAFEREMLEDEVVPDGTSYELARAIMRPVPLPGVLYAPLDALTAGLLPDALREPLGLRWRTRERLLFRAVIVGLRLVLRIAPPWLRVVPHARRWERRHVR